MAVKHWGYLFFLIIFLLGPCLVLAQQPTFGEFEVPLSSDLPSSIDVLAQDSNAIVRYMSAAFNVATALIVGVALILIVVAGYLYVTAGGNAQRVSFAKSLVGTSLLGIILALTAYIILDLFSPRFASQLQQPSPPPRPVINP